nr:serine hydrolase domain-containing protein [Kofleriaceae bacterium]
MFRRSAALPLLAVLAAITSCHDSGPRRPVGPVLAAHDFIEPIADRIANQLVADGEVAGLTIGIARKNGSVFVKAYGLADINGKVPATPTTIYRIGSLTKQFTAAAILQLVDAKKITLDDDILLYAKVDTGGRVVTLRHLLNHTSGIPNYTDTADFPEWSKAARTPQELVDHATKMLWEFEPGTHFHYSNTGYVLLGMVIEKVSGQRYADYLRDHVFAPAHLTATRYCDDIHTADRARGYAIKNDQLVDADPLDLTTPFSAGALCSTVPDLLAWQQALASGKVISPASYAVMSTPPTTTKSDYGMGVLVDTFEGHREIWHNGGINGFISELHAFPDDGVTIAVLTNSEGDSAPRVARELAYSALGMASKSVIPTARELDEVSGTYDVPGLGPTAFVARKHRLVVSPPKQGTLLLEFVGGDTFSLAEPPVTFVFHRQPGDNHVSSVTIQQAGRSLDAQRVDAAALPPAGGGRGSGIGSASGAGSGSGKR